MAWPGSSESWFPKSLLLACRCILCIFFLFYWLMSYSTLEEPIVRDTSHHYSLLQKAQYLTIHEFLSEKGISDLCTYYLNRFRRPWNTIFLCSVLPKNNILESHEEFARFCCTICEGIIFFHTKISCILYMALILKM
jgi:hypothetical protein